MIRIDVRVFCSQNLGLKNTGQSTHRTVTVRIVLPQYERTATVCIVSLRYDAYCDGMNRTGAVRIIPFLSHKRHNLDLLFANTCKYVGFWHSYVVLCGSTLFFGTQTRVFGVLSCEQSVVAE